MNRRSVLTLGVAASVAMGTAWLTGTLLIPKQPARLTSVPAIWETAPTISPAPAPVLSRPMLASRDDAPVSQATVSELPDIRPTATLPKVAAPVAQTAPLSVWQETFASGDTLDRLLSQAGIAAPMRARIATALGNEYDLRKIRPGHNLKVVQSVTGEPERVELEVSDGIRVLVTVGDDLTSETIEPDTRVVEKSGEVTVNGSIFASLNGAGVPASFAVDLSRILGGVVDFRRDLKGNEALRLLWSERLGPDGLRIGSPQLTYVSLALRDDFFEAVWPPDNASGVAVFRNGNAIRTFSPPVTGARLTSVFGMRRHPVYGDRRMHKGVDFAASYGAPVRATSPGKVAFIGRRGGYGRVVEITHGASTISRYTHLSSYADGLKIGERVDAGQVIGRVGSSGLTTGPNLHYEVRIKGDAVDPMGDDRLARLPENGAADAFRSLLKDARDRFSGKPDIRAASKTNTARIPASINGAS